MTHDETRMTNQCPNDEWPDDEPETAKLSRRGEPNLFHHSLFIIQTFVIDLPFEFRPSDLTHNVIVSEQSRPD